MTSPGLLEAAKRGDRDALERLLLEEQPRLYRFGLRMCGDPEDARDVLQESLLAAARALPEFEGRSSLSSWLFTIARSFCIKHRRRRAGQPALERSLEREAARDVATLADARPLPEEQVAAQELGQAVNDALSRLDPEQREVVVLRDVEGLSAEEAASVVGIGVPALKSRLHRARAALRAELAPVLGAVEPPEPGCPDVLALYSGKLEGDISQDACARVERHVSGCPRCRRACDGLQEALSLCRASPGPAVPPAVQEMVRRELRAIIER